MNNFGKVFYISLLIALISSARRRQPERGYPALAMMLIWWSPHALQDFCRSYRQNSRRRRN